MVNIIKPINKNWKRSVTIIVLGFFIITSSYTAIEKNPYVTPEYILNLSEWIKTNVKPNETVLLDEGNWWGLHILLFSGFSTDFKEDYSNTYEFATDQIRIVPAGGKKIDEKTVIGYLEKRPKYLVYFHNGKLAKVLNFSSGCHDETYNNYLFKCKYAIEKYKVYELFRK